jgi:transcriptional regulator with XRE-family HTH domain
VGKGKKHAALNKSLVRRLRGLRESRGITQAELAKRLAKQQSFVSKVERGQRQLDVVELRWWCDALDEDPSAV